MYNENKGFGYEEIAKKYLVYNNYEILKENFCSKFGEIDIIAQKDDILHFIEVKGKKDTKMGYPRESVTLAKQRKIISTAKYYLMLQGKDDFMMQFDVIEIILDHKKINHIENAF